MNRSNVHLAGIGLVVGAAIGYALGLVLGDASLAPITGTVGAGLGLVVGAALASRAAVRP